MPTKSFILLLALAMLAMPTVSSAQVSIGISIHVGPPALPVYVQPPPPNPGFIWTPGYWAYGDDGYYWVPGTWVEPPVVGVLWTPGYWGWREGLYVWNPGYWGPHVGFYGGINYGFGYGGVGFVGGTWNHGVYNYNRAVTNVNTTNTTIINNTYNNTTIVNNNTTINNNHTSFNGGPGGVAAQPTASERTAEQDRHIAPTAMQTQHQQGASTNRQLLASVNHGAPSVAASPRAGVFGGHGVTGANANSAQPAKLDRPAGANNQAHNANGGNSQNLSGKNAQNISANNSVKNGPNNGMRNDRPMKTNAMSAGGPNNANNGNRNNPPPLRSNNAAFPGGNSNHNNPNTKNAHANEHARGQEQHGNPHPNPKDDREHKQH